MLSEPDGQSVSSSRVVLLLVTLTGVGIAIAVTHHLCQVTDAAILAAWCQVIPVLGTFLLGLAGIPYAVNKAATTIGDLIASIKNNPK